MHTMRDKITETIRNTIQEYEKSNTVRWGEPLVGFAAADDPYILALPKIICQNHGLPEDVVPGAKTVIAYFVPFTKELAKTNRVQDRLASPQWAQAYEVTNRMLGDINDRIMTLLQNAGFKAGVSPYSLDYDRTKLISRWSHRHFAYAAGLGTFGMNNMLITPRGCCGRYSTVVTDFETETGHPREKELCIYKNSGKCGVCMKNCPESALSPKGFRREKCNEMCAENAAAYTQFGSSYTGGLDASGELYGSAVCGKCVTGSPCAFWNME